MKYKEKERELPVIGEYDVVVAGGGPAGIAAACCAGRQGASTLLVERYGYLGGMMTGSYVTAVWGMGDGDKQHIYGFAQEIYDRAAVLPVKCCRELGKCGDYDIDAEIFKWFSIIMLQEAGVKILLHSLACDAVVEKNKVGGIIVENKSGRQAILARAVIDATADADIAKFAGAAYELSKYDISLVTRTSGINTEKLGKFRDGNPGKYEQLISKAREISGGVMPGGNGCFKGYDATSAEQLSEIEIKARKSFVESMMFLAKNIPGYEDIKLDITSPQLGVRESRRIKGVATLTEEDFLKSRKFADSVSRCGAHMVGYETYGTRGLEYDIPYGCLIPKTADGLIVAGRCVSCSHEALNTMRLIAPCFATGQAAGDAAALSVKNKTSPRNVDIKELQAVLKSQKANLG